MNLPSLKTGNLVVRLPIIIQGGMAVRISMARLTAAMEYEIAAQPVGVYG